MKKNLLIIAIFMSIFSLAHAQRGTGERPSQSGQQQGQGQRLTPEQRLEQRVKELKDTLSLTDAQVTKVTEIYKKSAEKSTAMMEKNRAAREAGEQLDREEMMKQFTAIRTQESNDIKALLNDTQKPKFEKYLKNQETRFQRGQGQRGQGSGQGQRGGGQPGGGGNR